jgi:AMP-activated protein kinase-like protein
MTSRPLFVSFVAFAIAACGGGTSSGPTSTAQPAASAEPAAPAATAAPAGPATAPSGAAAGAKRPTAPGPNQTADGVVFNFKPEAGSGGKKIYLAGNFNDWKPDNPQYVMSNDGSGTFTITVKLPPGEYQYKYVVDGTKWIKDPYSPGDAPDGFGGQNGKFAVK